MSEGFDQWMASMEEMIEPYEGLAPMAVAFMLFPILTAVGVAKETTETREAVRLSLY